MARKWTDDDEKAYEWTKQEMMNKAEKGYTWRNSYDFWDDFKQKFSENKEIVVSAPLIVIGIIVAGIIIGSQNPEKVCDHYYSDENYGYRLVISNEHGYPWPTIQGNCWDCGKDFVVEAVDNTFISSTEATCTEKGTATYVAKFGQGLNEFERTYTIYEKDALGHLTDGASEPYVAPTCTSEGKEESYTCIRCNTYIEGKVIPMLEHKAVVLQAIEPTCQSDGRTESAYCEMCNQDLYGYESIPKLECDFESVVTEPTLTTTGYTTHTCKVCFDSHIDTYVKPLIYNDCEFEEITLDGGLNALKLKMLRRDYEKDNFTLPQTIDGLDVVEIGDYAFASCTIKTVTLPSTITSIGEGAFKDCASLESFTYNENIITIGKETFKGCTSLKEIDLKNVQTIDVNAFEACENLSFITLPTSLKSIGKNAFYGCVRMVEVYDLNNKFSAYYPENVVSIKTSLDQKSSVEVYGDYDCIRGNDGKLYVYRYNPDLTADTYVMPKTINDEDYTFLPLSLTGIRDYKNVTITKASQNKFVELITTSKNNIYVSMQATAVTLDIEESIPSNYFENYFQNVTKLTVKNLSKDYVVNMPLLEEVEMPIIFTKFSDMFYGHVYPSGIKKITVTSGTSIPNDYFNNLTNVEEINISNVESIGNHAFNNCKKIESINLDEGLLSIGDGAFSGCISLKDLTLPESLETIGDSAFEYCLGFETIIIPENVTYIGQDAFYMCANIKNVYNLSSLDIQARASTHGGVAENVYYVYTSLDEEAKIYYEDDYIFVMYSDNKYHLVEWLTNSEEIIMPETYKGEKYIIEQNAFSRITSVKSIVIQGITSIPNKAFSSNRTLETIVIKEDVTRIGSEAFSGCEYLEKLTLPNTIESIGENAFLECGRYATGTREVYYNGDVSDWIGISFTNRASTPLSLSMKVNNVTTLLYSILFKDGNEYKKVTTLTIPEDVTTIPNYQFYGFKDVENLYVHSGVKTIGSEAFSYFSNVKYAEMPALNGLKLIKLEEIKVTGFVQSAYFSNMTNLKKVTLVEGITTIYSDTFKNCTSLEEVVIPSTVNSIDMTAFDGCTSLNKLTISSDNLFYKSLDSGFGLVEIGTGTLLKGNATSVIDESIIHIGDNAFYGDNDLIELTLPNTIESIGDYAFNNCRNLTTINLPNSLVTIGDYAFSNCYSLADITLPTSIESIGNCAFYNCNNLTSADFSTYSNLKSIGNCAFLSCENISVINLPLTLETIGTEVFDRYINVTTITMPAVGAGIGAMFGNYSKVPNTIATVNLYGDIPNSYFSGCYYIKNINVINATSIGNRAFSTCEGLVNISLPETVVTIGDYAFSQCISLVSIELPSSVESMGESCFSYCTKLEEVKFKDDSKLKEIKDYTFNNCTSLAKIEIPVSVTKIGICFTNSATKFTIYYGGSEAQWSNIELANNYLAQDNAWKTQAQKVYNSSL